MWLPYVPREMKWNKSGILFYFLGCLFVCLYVCMFVALFAGSEKIILLKMDTNTEELHFQNAIFSNLSKIPSLTCTLLLICRVSLDI